MTAARRSGCGGARGRRFRPDRRATTALEFALVGPILLAMILFTSEVAYYLYAQLSLDFATTYAARQLLTGNSRPSQAIFVSASGPLCARLQALLSCSNLVVNLVPLAAGQSYSAIPPPIDLLPSANGQTPNPPTYQVGARGSLMVLQVVYRTPDFLWPLSAFQGTQTGRLFSTATFVNEI